MSMKVIVAGSREIIDPVLVYDAMIESGFDFDEIVSGPSAKPDTIGKLIALQLGITLKEFPADWDRYGKRAGVVRNHLMGDYADAAVCIWNGISPGTSDMIGYMRRLSKPVHVKVVQQTVVDKPTWLF